jgi:hypothetical protein
MKMVPLLSARVNVSDRILVAFGDSSVVVVVWWVECLYKSLMTLLMLITIHTCTHGTALCISIHQCLESALRYRTLRTGKLWCIAVMAVIRVIMYIWTRTVTGAQKCANPDGLPHPFQ